MIIGSHVSFKKDKQLVGSVEEALSYGSTTFMFYTGAPQNTNRQPIDNNLTEEAIELMRDKIDINNVIVHAPYIINLASSNDFAVDFLKQELKRVEQLKMTKLVLHPGSSVKLSREEGIKNIIDNLNKVGQSKVLILLETMAGKGTELGKNFLEIKEIIDGVNYPIGVCLDTCHINDAGYDLTNFDKILDLFDDIIGLDKLKCVHINDSKNLINTHKDRHENIGYGTIGFDNLIKIIYHDKLKGIPKILETPYVSKDDTSKEKLYPPYKFEIEMILNKKFNDNLINDIRNYYNDF
ncbi:MAG TPA: deoxyribonuclease IV [Candidatus Faecisoma merdavium]|nr:deoxyribonuclease IV [Candidatus Faecisoma merdavium]